VEIPRNTSVEGGTTEPTGKSVPSDRRIVGLPSPEVKGQARSRVPGGGEFFDPTSEDDVPCSSADLQEL
jgi:hypothetical protein